MGTSIEWTEETWNPTVGCSRVSPGCDNCYAIGVAHRAMQPAHEGLTIRTERGTDWTGEVRLLPDRLDVPLRWRKPRSVFVDSMSDLFHPDVPDQFVAAVLAVMSSTPQHTYQVLTKRPQRMADVMRRVFWDCNGDVEIFRYAEHASHADGRRYDDFGNEWPLPNVWLGTSIESDRYTFRADHLRATPAAVRFLSLEPLLGPLPSLDLTGIDWVIVGGESGPGARPMHPAWVRDLRDRCTDAGVAFFFKQWGAWGPIAPLDADGRYDMRDGHTLADDGTLYEPGDLAYPDGPRRGEALRARHDRGRLTAMYRVGKKTAGRELDGRTWDEMPV